jgi:hypothetical protein
MSNVAVMGRPSLFARDPKTKRRVQGYLSEAAATKFDAQRARLASIARQETGQSWEVSDAETLEFLCRGEKDTRRYLRERHK